MPGSGGQEQKAEADRFGGAESPARRLSARLQPMDNGSSTESASHSPSIQPEAIDFDILCPHCDYNLRGLTESRCPECGTHFDRERLLKWETEWGVGLLFSRSPGAYFHNSLLHAALFTPSRVGCELAPGVDPRQSSDHGWHTRLLGIAVLLIFSPMIGGHWDWMALVLCFFVAPAIILATVMCESLISGVLSHLVLPVRCPAVQAEAFWRSLCQCFSAHFPVTCIAVAVASVRFETFVLPAALACLLWWWACLGRAVLVRSVASPGRIVALLFVPVIACLSVLVGSALGTVCFLMAACVLHFTGIS
jgi:hypothetical protein